MQRICIYERFILMGPASSLKKKMTIKEITKTFWRWWHISPSPHESQTLPEAAAYEDAQFEALYAAKRPHQTTHSFNSSSLQHVFAVHDTLCRRSNYNGRRTVVSETDSAICFPSQTPNPHTFFRCKFLLHSANSLITKRQKDKNS